MVAEAFSARYPPGRSPLHKFYTTPLFVLHFTFLYCRLYLLHGKVLRSTEHGENITVRAGISSRRAPADTNRLPQMF